MKYSWLRKTHTRDCWRCGWPLPPAASSSWNEVRTDADEPILKRDDGKPRPDLIPPEAVLLMGHVLAAGARKYADWNWAPGTSWSHYYAAALRHLNAWQGGEDLDPETGLSHLGHALCCVSFLASYQARAVGRDDRPYKEVR
jgi:dATP/dGTP diphosphohydrolase